MKRRAICGIQALMRQGLSILLAGIFLVSCAGEAQTSGPRTVVLELFTSQGCSSCPPADALLRKLRGEHFDGATVIPLAYHVDYWNHLGWSDPFSSPRWSQRQRDYARVLKTSQVYTPQLVINGTTALVGSAGFAIRAEVERQAKDADRGQVSITNAARSGSEIKVSLQARLDATNVAQAVVYVVLFENDVTTSVSSGENAKKRLANDAIVRWQEKAMMLEANGVESKASLSVPLAAGWRPEHLGVAAFIQDVRTLAIHGSAVSAIESR
jgi:hypothetical protein